MGCLLLALVLPAPCQKPTSSPIAAPPVTLGLGVFAGRITQAAQTSPGADYDLQVLVEHVYYDPGPADRLAAGQTLTVSLESNPTVPGGENLHGPPPRPGQEALWVFSVSVKNALDIRLRNELFYSPSRQGVDPEYAHNLALAAAVEEVGQAPPGARYPRLLAAGRSGEFRVSQWAISRLKFVFSDAVFQDLRERLERGGLSLGGQVGADLVLNFNDWQGWRASPQRKALFRRWASGPLDAEAVEGVSSVLYNASLGPDLSLEDYLGLLRTLAANPTVPAQEEAEIQREIASVIMREAAPAKQGQ